MRRCFRCGSECSRGQPFATSNVRHTQRLHSHGRSIHASTESGEAVRFGRLRHRWSAGNMEILRNIGTARSTGYGGHAGNAAINTVADGEPALAILKDVARRSAGDLWEQRR